MNAQEKALLDKLAQTNPELKALMEEHRNLDVKLDEMNKRPYLSPEDDLERKKIQKAKLNAKDKIHGFLEANK